MSAEPVILMVDDNSGDRKLLAIVLGDAGLKARLRTAPDGVVGQEILQAMIDGREPMCRLALIDLNMPKMDGRALLAWMRAQPALQAVPTVILTSSHVARDRDDCLARGATDYMVKPAELDDFIGMVKSLGKYVT